MLADILFANLTQDFETKTTKSSSLLFRSFIIQTFADSFRQSVIDLMHGKIEHADDIKDDDVWEALLNVAQQTIIEPLAPDAPPKGYYNPGVLGAELKLLEPFVLNSRSDDGFWAPNDRNLYCLFFTATIWHVSRILTAKLPLI